jgi:hypothetical protein
MSEAKAEAPARTLVPTAAESGTTAIRRVRLAKALATTPNAKIPGLTRPPKQAGAKETRTKKPKPPSHRYKLTDDEHAQLTALKQRLETLGSSVKRSELLRAGLLLLLAMNDEQLKMTVTLAGVGMRVSLPPQAA